jgi:hypothetical protein
MDAASVKAKIVDLALHKFNNKCFPTKSGSKVLRAFRVPDDHQPLGFDYHGVSIEVHVQHVKDVLMPGTNKVYMPVEVLLILGIRKDGVTKVISEGVSAR